MEMKDERTVLAERYTLKNHFNSMNAYQEGSSWKEGTLASCTNLSND